MLLRPVAGLVQYRGLATAVAASSQSIHQQILATFPPPRHAFAYGSGVFQQTGAKATNENMIDYVFAVEDLVNWHHQNLAVHSHHYSALKYCGANALAKIGDSTGARVYYNTDVIVEGRHIKYGVVSVHALCCDLTSWDHLYLAGRMHKPVLTLVQDPLVVSASQQNLCAALAAALLFHAKEASFTDVELFTTISNLSYGGDFRMILGEAKNKVANIVSANLVGFRSLYKPLLPTFVEPVDSLGTTYRFAATTTVSGLISHLPVSVRPLKKMDDDAAAKYVQDKIRSIVSASSRSQSIKGIFTAGLLRSVLYAGAKLQKQFKS